LHLVHGRVRKRLRDGVPHTPHLLEAPDVEVVGVARQRALGRTARTSSAVECEAEPI
jgi:hypothetical protein